MEPQWVLCKSWRPGSLQRKEGGPSIPSLPVAGSLVLMLTAWLLPFLVLSWQMDHIRRNAAFESALKRPTSWLRAQAGAPQWIRHWNRDYTVWHYDRGSFQVELAVDRHSKIQAVRYLHQ